MNCPPEYWCISKIVIADLIVGGVILFLVILLIFGAIALVLGSKEP